MNFTGNVMQALEQQRAGAADYAVGAVDAPCAPPDSNAAVASTIGVAASTASSADLQPKNTIVIELAFHVYLIL